MSGNTFVSNRLDLIESRFDEISVILDLADANSHKTDIYSALCRSAHVLLVSHVEGIYKDIVKDIIDDLNRSTKFNTVKNSIFRTHSHYYLIQSENDKINEKYKSRLFDALKSQKTALILEPFLRVDNKNPTPKILEEILGKFGEKNFFKSLIGSRLEIVFENDHNLSFKELQRIKKYLRKGVTGFPFTLDKNFFCNPSSLALTTDKKSLFEEFLNDFLNDRHKIVHGQTLQNPKNHREIEDSKIKIEILIYAFIINLCHFSNPVIHI